MLLRYHSPVFYQKRHYNRIVYSLNTDQLGTSIVHNLKLLSNPKQQYPHHNIFARDSRYYYYLFIIREHFFRITTRINSDFYLCTRFPIANRARATRYEMNRNVSDFFFFTPFRHLISGCDIDDCDTLIRGYQGLCEKSFGNITTRSLTAII